jgi:hypothetical protein
MVRIGPTFIAFLIALSAIPAVAEFDTFTIISQPVASSRQSDGRIEAIHQAHTHSGVPNSQLSQRHNKSST